MAALGNYHASELVFVWGVNGTFLDPLLGGAVHPMDAVTQQVDDSFTLYWGSFVNSGSPNGADELGVAEAAAAECEWNGGVGVGHVAHAVYEQIGRRVWRASRVLLGCWE